MAHISILIAGTSNSYLEISKKMLKFHYTDCDVEFAYTGKECIDKAFAREYSLVLFDYDFSDMDGLEIIDTLLKKNIKSPLVMLVEEGDEKQGVQAIEQGATDYILKVRGYLTALPFTIRNLVEKKNHNGFKKEAPVKKRASAQKPLLQSDRFFILDVNGKIISANNELQKISSMSEQELNKLSFFDLLSKEKSKSFFDYLERIKKDEKESGHSQTKIVNKFGEFINVEIKLSVLKDALQQLISYQGEIKEIQPEEKAIELVEEKIDTLTMVQKLTAIITSGYDLPLPAFVERITQLVCETTRFERGTLAILDKRKNTYIKQAMIGYGSFPAMNAANIEVSHEVIEKVFEGRYKVKVIYFNQNQRNTAAFLNSKYPERRSQKRRPQAQWHPRDLILVNLLNEEGSFGYISLDRPIGDLVPGRDMFENLEVLGQLISFALENFYHFSTIEKRSRRLKQVLVTNNIFKLHLGLNELLREVVWSIKFSLNFNLVALGLISKRTGRLEIKASACEDKTKAKLLTATSFDIQEISNVLKSDYRIGKSYFIENEESVFESLKQIYGSPKKVARDKSWPESAILSVPIKSSDGKIIGLILLDDPEDKKSPSPEIIQILELLANQIGVAIDNRILYVKTKNNKINLKDKPNRIREFSSNDSGTPVTFSSNIKRHRFVDKFFK